ncbi:Fur family transcriptional regulator [Cryobacterium psychrophilum]|uniref:Transcriptional repressor n=1 Tax=Cryobacterium psychrophilum TaxID=41988 RepID=A0A4Y8KHY8_9MICO|nr:Fur family transcriptional regulator [Cryobacterium psychrophilum]TDW29229.1 Fur family ferric uptake transcriptional regulator [Cryobacterium psychrophilum]TFD74673.1 transcriptional repressor [Cryobacterium psychrophilum]
MTHTGLKEAGATESLAADIRAVGLKVTEPRLAVLRALTVAPHSSADRLFASISVELPNTSRQAVYGVLYAFTEGGLVRKIEPAGSAALFERRVGDNHHHLVCTRCSAVHDVDCAVGSAPCLVPENTSGFAVHAAEVTYWGLCPACQTELATFPSLDNPTQGVS